MVVARWRVAATWGVARWTRGWPLRQGHELGAGCWQCLRPCGVIAVLGYGWLAGEQRATTPATAGLTLMGARVYNNKCGLLPASTPNTAETKPHTPTPMTPSTTTTPTDDGMVEMGKEDVSKGKHALSSAKRAIGRAAKKAVHRAEHSNVWHQRFEG